MRIMGPVCKGYHWFTLGAISLPGRSFIRSANILVIGTRAGLELTTSLHFDNSHVQTL